MQLFDQMSTAVIYPRVSSEDQQERETIESQIEFAKKYCDLHQINILDWYKDDGVTGTIPLDERPEGKRLVEDAKAGKFKLLLIYNLKRLGRSARVILNAVYELEKYGVVIKSMTEPFDTGNPTGRFLLTILAGVAELDRDSFLETTWHGANRVARLGQWLGGIVPYGYKVNSQKLLEICEDPIPGKEQFSEAGVVRLMYQLIAGQKWSTIQVADYFNDLKIPTSYIKDGRSVRRGKRKERTAGVWTPSRIGNMVKNSTYKGLHIYGKRSKKDRELIERRVPAIVSEQIWEQAQLVLRDNQIEATRNAKRQNLLRGIIKCGCCGLTYIGTTYAGKGRAPQAFYTCSGKISYRGPLQGKCTSKNIPANWIEETVWNECVRFIWNPGDALVEFQKGLKENRNQSETLSQEKALVLKSIQEKESERQTILTLFRQKMITAIDVEKQLQEIIHETNALEIRIRELDGLLSAEESLSKQFSSADALLCELREKITDNPTFETKREIVKILVGNIIVHTDIPDPEKPFRKKASVSVRYSFSSPRGVNRTGARAVNTLGIRQVHKSPIKGIVPVAAESHSSGQRLRQIRMQREYSITELAEKTGLSKRALQELEEDRSLAKLPTLRKLASELDVSVAYLGMFEDLPEDTLGEQIRKARLCAGLLMKELADELGVNEKTIRLWERGAGKINKENVDLIQSWLES